MAYDLNDPNLDFDIEQEAIINALKGARKDRRAEPPELTGRTWAPSGSALGGIGAALTRAAGGINESRAMREQRALAGEQQRRFDTLQQELTAPMTKEVEGYSYGQGPLMDLSEQPRETVPQSPLEQSKRRLDIYSRMSRLPMARGLAQAGIKSEVDFPERQALLEQQQLQQRELQAQRLAQQQSQNDMANFFKLSMLGQGQQRIDQAAQVQADKAAQAAQKRGDKIVAGAEKEEGAAQSGLSSMDDVEANILKVFDPETGKLTPAARNATGPWDSRVPEMLRFNSTNAAASAIKSLQDQMTMINLADAKNRVGQSFGSMQVREWEKFQNQLRNISAGIPDAEMEKNLGDIYKFVQKKKSWLNEAMRQAQEKKAGAYDEAPRPSAPSRQSGGDVSAGAKVVSRVKLKDGSTGVLWSDGSRTRE